MMVLMGRTNSNRLGAEVFPSGTMVLLYSARKRKGKG